ncbi:hypothetical protein TrVFT333_001630 [Trichoderma virens FT-333]|nr:hypothetical protein TrVFT333_001630 [Trichoderma virens FT-333]
MPALPLLSRRLVDELATRTSHGDAASLVARQQGSAETTFVVIPDSYGSLHDSLTPGAIVGIVIASVVGFILLLLVIYTILGFGPVSTLVRTAEVTESKSYVSRSMLSSARPKSEKPKKKVPSMHGARVLSIRRERTTRTSKRRSERRGKEPVIVEPAQRKREPSPLTTISSSSGAGPAPRRDPLPSDYDEDNEVVVIEETTPSSRRHSRKAGPSRDADGRGRRSSSRRSSYSEYDDRRYRR